MKICSEWRNIDANPEGKVGSRPELPGLESPKGGGCNGLWQNCPSGNAQPLFGVEVPGLAAVKICNESHNSLMVQSRERASSSERRGETSYRSARWSSVTPSSRQIRGYPMDGAGLIAVNHPSQISSLFPRLMVGFRHPPFGVVGGSRPTMKVKPLTIKEVTKPCVYRRKMN